jgi:hypothetical protein
MIWLLTLFGICGVTVWHCSYQHIYSFFFLSRAAYKQSLCVRNVYSSFIAKHLCFTQIALRTIKQVVTDRFGCSFLTTVEANSWLWNCLLWSASHIPVLGGTADSYTWKDCYCDEYSLVVVCYSWWLTSLLTNRCCLYKISHYLSRDGQVSGVRPVQSHCSFHFTTLLLWQLTSCYSLLQHETETVTDKAGLPV